MEKLELYTTRLLIRNFTLSDATDLYEILGDRETMKNCEPAYTPEQTSEFLERFCINKKGAVAAADKQSGKVIGYILFNEQCSGVYEIGWFFNRNFWHQGYAYEACQALINYAFSQKRIHKVFAETIDLVKSVPLMEKLGMQREGVQRSHIKDYAGKWADFYLYGLLKEDWENRPRQRGKNT